MVAHRFSLFPLSKSVNFILLNHPYFCVLSQKWSIARVWCSKLIWFCFWIFCREPVEDSDNSNFRDLWLGNHWPPYEQLFIFLHILSVYFKICLSSDVNLFFSFFFTLPLFTLSSWIWCTPHHPNWGMRTEFWGRLFWVCDSQKASITKCSNDNQHSDEGS